MSKQLGVEMSLTLDIVNYDGMYHSVFVQLTWDAAMERHRYSERDDAVTMWFPFEICFQVIPLLEFDILLLYEIRTN